MGIALGKHTQKRRHRRQPSKRQLIVKNSGGGGFRQLHRVNAELVIEPCAPFDFHSIPRLENGADASRAATLHQTWGATICTGKYICNDARLAMWTAVQKNAVVSPSHRSNTCCAIAAGALWLKICAWLV